MKVYRLDDFTSIDNLHMREEDALRPKQGEVLIRVHAISLNFRTSRCYATSTQPPI